MFPARIWSLRWCLPWKALVLCWLLKRGGWIKYIKWAIFTYLYMLNRVIWIAIIPFAVHLKKTQCLGHRFITDPILNQASDWVVFNLGKGIPAVWYEITWTFWGVFVYEIIHLEVSWVIGVPPVIIHFSRNFPEINQPIYGVPPWLWKPPLLGWMLIVEYVDSPPKLIRWGASRSPTEVPNPWMSTMVIHYPHNPQSSLHLFKKKKRTQRKIYMASY